MYSKTAADARFSQSSKVFDKSDTVRRTIESVQKLNLDTKCALAWHDGKWFGEGAAIITRAAWSSVTGSGTIPTSGAYLDVAPTYSQLLSNSQFSGFTPGVVGSGAVIPAASWQEHDGGAAKTIIVAGAGALEWSVTGWNGSSGGGFRSAVDVTPGDAVVISLNVSITGVAANREVFLGLAWWNPSTSALESQVGGSFGTQIASSYDAVQGGRVTVLLPNPGGARRLVIFAGAPSGQDNSGVAPTIRVSDVLVSKNGEVGSDPGVQPAYASASVGTARDIVLRLDAGQYVIVGRRTNGQVLGRRVTVAGTSGQSLLAAIGAAQLSHVYVIPAAVYDPRDVEFLFAPEWQSTIRNLPGATVPAFSPKLAAQAMQTPMSVNGKTADGGSPRRTLQSAYNVQSLVRMMLVSGDIAPGDAGSTKERGELGSLQKFPYGVPFVTAGWMTADELPPIAPQRTMIVRQMRYDYVPVGGESDPGVHPDCTVNIYPRRAGGQAWPTGTVLSYAEGRTADQWGLNFRAVLNGSSPYTDDVATNNNLTSLANGDGTAYWVFDTGQWVYVVTRVTMAQGGAGKFEAWINVTGMPGGQTKILDLTGNFGHGGVANFTYKTGLYDGAAGTSAPTRRMRHHQIRFGASFDAETLAYFPEPRLVS